MTEFSSFGAEAEPSIDTRVPEDEDCKPVIVHRVSRCIQVSHWLRLRGLTKRRSRNGADGLDIATSFLPCEHGAEFSAGTAATVKPSTAPAKSLRRRT